MRQKKRRSSHKKAGRGPNRLGEWLLVPIRFYESVPPRFMGFISLFLFLLIAWFMVNWILNQAKTIPTYRVDPNVVRCTGRPSWLDMSLGPGRDVMADIKRTVDGLPNESIFNDAFIRLLRHRIEQGSTWVDDVVAVERVFPAQVKVRLRLRQPTALFYRRNSGYYIDARGVVIDVFRADAAGGAGRQDLAQIQGMSLVAAPRLGSVYPDEALKEGAAVAHEVGGLVRRIGKDAIEVTVIDVSGYGRQQPDDVVLITRGGARILWGRSARHSEYRGIDPTPEEKTRNLEKILKLEPRLDGVAEVTLTFKQPSYTLRTDSVTDND